MGANNIKSIQFHYSDVTFRFPDRTKLKFFLIERLRKEGQRLKAINYIFCTDAYLLELNRQFLHHDTYTDIVTFPLSSKGEPLISDIYISIDRVKENAFSFSSGFQKELHRVIFHGLLHLCGFKDKTTKQAKIMRLKEDEYLNAYFRST
jgi:rRNA maturation RNase YbeY